MSLPLALKTIWHTAAIFLFLIIGFRFLAHRLLGQLTVADFLVVLLMGSAVETAMVVGNTSLPSGLLCAGVLFLLDWSLSRLSDRFQKCRGIFGGSALVLVHEGRIVEESLKRSGLTREEVEEGLRGKGITSLSRVRFAILEADGQISAASMERRVLKTKAKKEASA